MGLRNFLPILSLLGLTTVLAPGCTDYSDTIFVRMQLADPKPAAGEGCKYTNDPTQPTQVLAIADLGLTSNYSAMLLLGNHLVKRDTNPEEGKADSSGVQIQRAIVTVKRADGSVINEFTSLTQGYLDPSSGGSPSYGVAAVPIIDSKTAALILKDLAGTSGKLTRGASETLLAVVQVQGTSNGGTALETGPYELPIATCYGCLVNFPSDSVDTEAKTQPNCLKAPEGGTVSSVCTLGANQPVDCRLCQATNADGTPTYPVCVP